jgi:hypothetical protein
MTIAKIGRKYLAKTILEMVVCSDVMSGRVRVIIITMHIGLLGFKPLRSMLLSHVFEFSVIAMG